MPGVIGYVSNKPINPELLDAMIQPMLHRPTYQVRKRAKRNFTVGTIDLAQNTQNDHIESQDSRYTLVFSGALYESWVNGKNGIASKLLDRWIKGGWKALADLNGEYLIVVWDHKEETLTIVNDRLGLKRLNYWQGNGTFAFASEVKSIAVISEVNRAIDEHALSELLTFGHLQDDRTLLRDVKMLPYASYLTWQAGKLKINQYWDYVYQEDSRLRDHGVAVDEYFQRTWIAVERRLKDIKNPGLFLSGGLDSRTLGGFIRKIHPQDNFFTWTAGHGHDHDTRYARQIAKEIRSEHKSLSVPETFLQDYGPEYCWLLDGIVSVHGAHRSLLIEEANGKVDTVFLGFMGDTVSGGKPLDKVHQLTNVEDIAQKGYESYAAGFDNALFEQTLRPEVFKRINGLVFESFRASIKRAKVELPGDRVVYAELVQRQRMYNPPAQMDLQAIDLPWSTPFTDKEFIDFSVRLPWMERLHKEAYIGMLLKYFPEIARVPRSGYGLPLSHSRIRESLHWRRVLFQRNTLPKLTGGRFGGHNYGPFVHCAEWFRKVSNGFIREKLINNQILEEHFQVDQVNNLVNEFLEGKTEKDLMEAIAALMTYVLFRERLNALSTYQPQSGFSAQAVAVRGVPSL